MCFSIKSRATALEYFTHMHTFSQLLFYFPNHCLISYSLYSFQKKRSLYNYYYWSLCQFNEFAPSEIAEIQFFSCLFSIKPFFQKDHFYKKVARYCQWWKRWWLKYIDVNIMKIISPPPPRRCLNVNSAAVNHFLATSQTGRWILSFQRDTHVSCIKDIILNYILHGLTGRLRSLIIVQQIINMSYDAKGAN